MKLLSHFAFITFICISFSNFVLNVCVFFFLLFWFCRFCLSIFPFLLFHIFCDNIRCLVKDDVMMQWIRLNAKCWITFVVSRNCYLVIAQQTRTSSYHFRCDKEWLSTSISSSDPPRHPMLWNCKIKFKKRKKRNLSMRKMQIFLFNVRYTACE